MFCDDCVIFRSLHRGRDTAKRAIAVFGPVIRVQVFVQASVMLSCLAQAEASLLPALADIAMGCSAVLQDIPLLANLSERVILNQIAQCDAAEAPKSATSLHADALEFSYYSLCNRPCC